jgi:hypothetical protein
MFNVFMKNIMLKLINLLRRVMVRKLCFLFMVFVVILSSGMVGAPVDPGVLDFGSLPYRRINVDGFPDDWEGIPPLILDPLRGEESGVDYDEEDIGAVYGANDEDYLYFLMELHHNEAETLRASLFDVTFSGNYSFYLDIRDGGDQANNRADYHILFSFLSAGAVVNVSEVNGDFNGFYFEGVELYEWTGSEWVHRTDCPGIRGEKTQYFIEVGVPWDCIGGVNCFNSFFKAHYEEDELINASDYAPNQEGQYVMVGCCPH